MQDHDDNNTTTTQDYDPDHFQAASTSTHNTQPATTSTSENMKKSGGQWTDNKVKLLLNYVESNCTLTTVRGLTLKKLEFNKAHATIKLKDANQCHYKWGQVHIFIINNSFHYLCICAISHIQYTKQFHSGTKSLAAAGTMTMVLMHEPQVKKKYLRNFWRHPSEYMNKSCLKEAFYWQ